MSLKTLSRRAHEIAKIRGHNMGRFYAGYRDGVKLCDCRDCGRYLEININPYPNEIDIGGSAVLSCTGKE